MAGQGFTESPFSVTLRIILPRGNPHPTRLQNHPMSETQRFAACLEYCGLDYSGWQHQKNAVSVQDQVETAISRVADEEIRVVVAGRTDAGVHGSSQIIHFDTRAARDSRAWLRGVNTWLPEDISLLWTHPVSDSFHARFSALERSYRYVILNRAVPPAYLHGRVAWHHAPLQIAPMRRAAGALLGRHDFSAFRAAGCQAKSPVRRIRRIRIEQSGAWLWVDISADGFLKQMVRNIVGTLLRIGEGREAAAWAGQLLAQGDRRRAGATASAAGLYFVGARYHRRFRLPPTPAPCRFW